MSPDELGPCITISAVAGKILIMYENMAIAFREDRFQLSGPNVGSSF